MKMVIRFEKSSVASSLTNDKIIDLFKQVFLEIPNSFSLEKISLGSTNQKYGIILGIDYLFADLAEVSYIENNDLIEAINKILGEKISVSHIVSISDLTNPNINKYAYYEADLSDFDIPIDFSSNLTLIMTRDTNFSGENISVTENTYSITGNQQKSVLKTYSIIELVPHIHYISEQKKLYFITDGNVPAFVILAGLLFGKCNFSNELVSNIRLSRLDYIDSQQRITHTSMDYDNVLGEYISIY